MYAWFYEGINNTGDSTPTLMQLTPWVVGKIEARKAKNDAISYMMGRQRKGVIRCVKSIESGSIQQTVAYVADPPVAKTASVSEASTEE